MCLFKRHLFKQFEKNVFQVTMLNFFIIMLRFLTEILDILFRILLSKNAKAISFVKLIQFIEYLQHSFNNFCQTEMIYTHILLYFFSFQNQLSKSVSEFIKLEIYSVIEWHC